MARRAAVVVPALVLVVAGWQRRWTTDDGFINFRVVRMLLEGHGPVFNVGERVEAYTSPLWIAVLTVGDLLLPLRLEYVAVVCSLAFAGVGLAALAGGSMRLLGPAGDRWWMPFGTLMLLALPPVWDFATSGLEFGLTLWWLGSLWWVVARWATAARPLTLAEAVVVGLGPLVRPDAAVYSLAVVVLVVAARWHVETMRERLVVLGAVAALPVAYELFRMAYFAAVVPNTVLAKAADVSHWREGFAYLWNLVRPYGLYVPLGLAAFAAVVVARPLPARQRLAMAVLPIAGLVHAAAIVRAGGDYQHARLLLPSVVAVVAPVAVVPVRRAVVVPVGAAAVWAAVAAGSLRVGGSDTSGHTIVADGRSAIVGFIGVEHPVTTDDLGWGHGGRGAYVVGNDGIWVDGERLAAETRPGVAEPVVLMRGVGVPAYALGPRVYVFDRLGLADPVISRFVVSQAGFVGHEKPVPAAWAIAMLTDDAVDPDDLGPDVFAVPLYESPAGRFDEDVAAAEDALACRRLRDLRDATTAPLTIERALSNVWQAVGLSALQVSPDPNEARRELC